MDKLFQKFLRSGIDLSSVGIGHREDNAPYFCTPKGASILGWTGVDGIHFCFIRGFGGMVFSVNPMNTAPNFVHPLAKDFGDFLRLLLACGDEAAIEQSWMWNEPQFEAFLRENPPTERQMQTLREVAEKMKLTPMEKPFAYIKALQSDFDYSKIKYTEDYYDTDMNPAAEAASPEWKVYFGGSFWGHSGRDRAGKEIPLNREFDWAGHHWVIPAAYSCGKGLVLFFCMRVDPEMIRGFMEKWNLSWENDSRENFTREQQMQMEWDNPLRLNFHPRLTLNGKKLRADHGSSVCFNPCLPKEFVSELEAKIAIEHFGLDDSFGWVISRSAFPWEGKRPAEIRSLSLTMTQQPGQLPGPHFQVHAPGDTFSFLHPVSGKTYTLTVQEVERQEINGFDSSRWIYPTHFMVMTYTLSPETAEDISIFDCDEGDKPREIEDSLSPASHSACSVGIIGGADGPTAIIFGKSSQRKLHCACSSLHFAPVQEDIQWRIVFQVRQFAEAVFSLFQT